MSNRIVHTKGSIGRRGVALGKMCETCPGGCKTDCLRAGVHVEQTKFGGDIEFSIDFAMLDDGRDHSDGDI